MIGRVMAALVWIVAAGPGGKTLALVAPGFGAFDATSDRHRT